MKRNIILLVVVSTIASSDCGVIENMYGTVRNKTHEVRDDVTNWIASGVDYFFSDKPEQIYNRNAAETEIALNESVDDINREKGILRSLYDAAKERVGAISRRVYTTVFGGDIAESKKGLLSKIYEKVENYTRRIRNQILGVNEQDIENTKKLNDAAGKLFLLDSNNTPHLTNETIQNLINSEDLKKAVMNLIISNQGFTHNIEDKVQNVAERGQNVIKEVTKVQDAAERRQNVIKEAAKVQDAAERGQNIIKEATKIQDAAERGQNVIKEATKVQDAAERGQNVIKEATKVQDAAERGQNVIKEATKVQDAAEKGQNVIKEATKVQDAAEKGQNVIKKATNLQDAAEKGQNVIKEATKVQDAAEKGQNVIKEATKVQDTTEKRRDEIMEAITIDYNNY